MPDSPQPTRDEIGAAIAEKAWKDETFHRDVLADPNKAYERYLGIPVPDGVTIKVLEDTSGTVHFVLPVRPADRGQLSDDELNSVAGGVQVQTRSAYNPAPIPGTALQRNW